jgi:hypothetical protein
MNLTAKQLVGLAGHIDLMTEAAVKDPKVRISGRFSIELEWQEAGRGTSTGQYLLCDVNSQETTR